MQFIQIFKYNKKIRVCVFCLFFLCFFSACKKFVDIDPPKTQLINETVFASDATATSAMVGIYSSTMGSNFNGFLARYSGLSADELLNYASGSLGTDQAQFYQNSIAATNNQIINFWRECYKPIFACNALIEGLQKSSGVSTGLKRQLDGEARFMRAFYNFYLVNLYGDIPLITTTDYRINATASRTSKTQVYQQIIADLKDAQNLLTDTYVTTERVRPNKWAATAMLARVYLYNGDWANAEIQATAVINQSETYQLIPLNTIFLANSLEAIWQLMPVRPTRDTEDGNIFILIATPTIVALSNQIVSAFEAGDNRKSSWVSSITINSQTYYYAYKYKIRTSTVHTEYYMALRLAEQYLIRAESKIQQGRMDEGIADLNVLRTRARAAATPATPNPLPPLSIGMSKANALLAVEQERRVELFCEWGHRWLDLKRTDRANAILSPVKTAWQSTDALYPIPQSERLNNQNLTQNPGY